LQRHILTSKHKLELKWARVLRKVRTLEGYTADIRDSVQLPSVLADVVMSYVNVPAHMRRGGVPMKRNRIHPMKELLEDDSIFIEGTRICADRSVFIVDHEANSMILLTSRECGKGRDGEWVETGAHHVSKSEWIDFARGWPHDAFIPQIPGFVKTEDIWWIL
jgi:hypothetical protein